MREPQQQNHHLISRRKHTTNQERAGNFSQGKSKAQEEFDENSHEEPKSIFYGMQRAETSCTVFPFHFLCFQTTQGNLVVHRPSSHVPTELPKPSTDPAVPAIGVSVTSSFALKAVVPQHQTYRWPNILFCPRNAPIRQLTPESCHRRRRLSPLIIRTICCDAVVRQGRDAAKRQLKRM